MLKNGGISMYYLKTFLALFSVTTINAILGIITTVKIANLLGPALYGEIVYGFALGGIFCVIVKFGTDKSLVRDYLQQPERTAEIFNAVICFKVILSTLLIITATLYAFLFDTVGISVAALLIAIGVTLSAFQLQSLYDAKKCSTVHAKYFLIHRLFYFSVVWIFITFFPNIFTNIIPAAATLIAVVLFVVLQFKGSSSILNKTSIVFNSSDVKELILKNWLFAISSLLVVGVTSVSQLIVASKLDMASLGLYGVCFQFVSMSSIVVKQVARIGKRELVVAITSKPDKTFLIISAYVVVLLLSVSPIAILCIFEADWLLSILFNKEYAVGSKLLEIMGLFIACNAVLIAIEQAAIARGIQVANLVANATNGLLVCGISFLYIDQYGVNIVAWSLVIGALSAALLTGLYLLFFKRPTTLDLKEV